MTWNQVKAPQGFKKVGNQTVKKIAVCKLPSFYSNMSGYFIYRAFDWLNIIDKSGFVPW
jgi:hypothetical protein